MSMVFGVMTWHGSVFRITDPLCRESIAHCRIPLTKCPVIRSFEVSYDVILTGQAAEKNSRVDDDLRRLHGDVTNSFKHLVSCVGSKRIQPFLWSGYNSVRSFQWLKGGFTMYSVNIPTLFRYALFCCDYVMSPTRVRVIYLPTLQCRHNRRDGVSNHQSHGCLLNRLFRHRWKKTSKLRVTGLCVGNSAETGEFPAQMTSNAENVSIWWRHHVSGLLH